MAKDTGIAAFFSQWRSNVMPNLQNRWRMSDVSSVPFSGLPVLEVLACMCIPADIHTAVIFAKLRLCRRRNVLNDLLRFYVRTLPHTHRDFLTVLRYIACPETIWWLPSLAHTHVRGVLPPMHFPISNQWVAAATRTPG